MSFFDSASLVQIPSGVKDGVLYSVKPIDGSGDLTFSRGSDIEATRVNANGYIEKAKVNLLTYSNTFSSWTATNTTLTSGQSGYDGTSDAWLLEATAPSGRVGQSYSASGVFSLSLYAKAGSVDWLRLRILASVEANAWFNLNTGSVGYTDGNIDATITSAGGGWYRLTLTANVSSISDIRFYPAADDEVNGDTGDNVYIQDAQLNYGLIAQEYQETTTAAVVSGITDNMPRLSYDPANPTCPSLLLEPSRQNIIAQAEYLASSYWSTLNAQFTANATTSPEGVQNAFKLGGTTGGADQVYVGVSLALPAGGTYTYSFFAKADDKSWVRLRSLGFDAAANTQTWFNLADGTIGNDGSGNAKIENYGNGWYRCSYSLTTTTDLVGSVYAYLAESNGGYAVDRDGSGIFLWGAQLEAGSYPTSYIPTYGSSATRTADACSKTGISSLIGQTEGTLFVDIDFDNSTTNYELGFALSDNATPTTKHGWLGRNNSNRLAVFLLNSGYQLQYSPASGGIISTGHHKLALAYASNDAVVYIDGVQVASSSSVNVPTMNTAEIGLFRGAVDQANSKVNQALVFKTRLSNADLATLTTL